MLQELIKSRQPTSLIIHKCVALWTSTWVTGGPAGAGKPSEMVPRWLWSFLVGGQVRRM